MKFHEMKWIDDVDSWPNVTYIHVGMYLLFSLSPYTQDQLMNYKSLDCYQNFSRGFKQGLWQKSTLNCKGEVLHVEAFHFNLCSLISFTSPFLLSSDQSLIANCFICGLIILRECPKSLWHLGLFARSLEKCFLCTVIAWLVLEKAAHMSLLFCGPSKQDANAGTL